LRTPVLFSIFAVLWLYFFSNVILANVSEKALDRLVPHIRFPELEYTRPIFRNVGFTSYNRISWYSITFNLGMTADRPGEKFDNITINIRELSLSLDSLKERRVGIRARGISADKLQSDSLSLVLKKNPENRTEAGHFEMQLNFRSLIPHKIPEQLRDFLDELKEFLRTGVTNLPVKFSAKEAFLIKGKPFVAKVRVQKEGDQYRLMMDETDLHRMGSFGGKILPTSGDIRLLARNPVRAPQLLKIRDKAESAAALAHDRNPAVPEDAYRHILWSYLLTRAFGEDFAREVTDAHESEADSEEISRMRYKSFDVDRFQDFHNNALGRSYAVQGRSESEILDLVMTDPEVIRDKEAETRFKAAQRSRQKKHLR